MELHFKPCEQQVPQSLPLMFPFICVSLNHVVFACSQNSLLFTHPSLRHSGFNTSPSYNGSFSDAVTDTYHHRYYWQYLHVFGTYILAMATDLLAPLPSCYAYLMLSCYAFFYVPLLCIPYAPLLCLPYALLLCIPYALLLCLPDLCSSWV